MTTMFPDYVKVLEEIASGGMGTVFKAEWHGREAAIKVPSDAYETTQILRDGRVLSSLDHPNLARIYEIGGKAPAVYVVMEFLSGGTLRDRIDAYRNPTEALSLIEQLASGLAYLHENGFIHRDVKPENVMFDDSNIPRVVDFGIAKAASPDGGFSLAATTVGSHQYASPEMLGEVPAARLSYESDVYSLGVILFELLTGRASPLVEDDWRPSLLNSGVTGAVDQICLGCLQVDPGRRWTTRKLIESIESLAKGRFPSIALSGASEYPKVRIGDITLNVTKIFGGDGHTRYTHPDGIIVRRSDETFHAPEDVQEVTRDWLTQKTEGNKRSGVPFENRDQPRIDTAGCGFTDEATESLHPMMLLVGRTKYFDTQITNGCIDFLLPDRRNSIRDKYAGVPDDFSTSQLANPLAINLSVITSDGYIYVAQRGKYVGVNQVLDPKDKNRVPAVSGTGHPDLDVDDNGVFCPFRAAKREAEEEVFGAYDLSLSEIAFFGLARTTGYFFPFLFGEIRTTLTRAGFESQPSRHINDVIAKWGRPFTIEAVTEWILELAGLSGLSHTAMFSLYQSLIYGFRGQIDDINSRLCRTR